MVLHKTTARLGTVQPPVSGPHLATALTHRLIRRRTG